MDLKKNNVKRKNIVHTVHALFASLREFSGTVSDVFATKFLFVPSKIKNKHPLSAAALFAASEIEIVALPNSSLRWIIGVLRTDEGTIKPCYPGLLRTN